MFQFKASDCRFAQVNGVRLRYYDIGKGKPLLLLHGFPDDLSVWKKLMPLFVKAGYRVIAFDQRGFGDSDMLPKQRDYLIETIVSDIPALLAFLAIKEPVYLIGHDWGAVIAWAFCLAHPERVHASVKVSVGHPQSYGRSGIEQKLVKGFYTLWFQFTGLAELYLKNGAMKRWLGDYSEAEFALQRMMRQGRLSAGLNWYRANFLKILCQRWPECKVPTLGVWSDQDPFLTEQQMLDSERYMQAEWAYFKVENAGHWIPIEQPNLLAEQAIAWFKRFEN